MGLTARLVHDVPYYGQTAEAADQCSVGVADSHRMISMVVVTSPRQLAAACELTNSHDSHYSMTMKSPRPSHCRQ